jgi:hypothetical protein
VDWFFDEHNGNWINLRNVEAINIGHQNALGTAFYFHFISGDVLETYLSTERKQSLFKVMRGVLKEKPWMLE